jgi:DNA-binding CsgD family transcriptional regulator
MQGERIEPLIEAVYDAAVDPEGWPGVMALLHRTFSASAATLYSLDYARRRMRPVEISGISDRFQESFESSFFTDDNPSARSPALHRPGVIRTDQLLDEYFRDDGVLRRSRYYDEWLRPQDLAHTMGMTPLAGDGIVFNISLLRSPAAGPFRPEEIARFEAIHPHFCRSLRMAARLESLAASRGAGAEALDGLAQGVVFVNPLGRVLHCNAAAEALVRRGGGLTIRANRLAAADPRVQQQLAALLWRAQDPAARIAGAEPRSLLVPRPDGQRPLVLNAVPLSPRRSRFVAPLPTVMLLIADPDAPRRIAADLLPVLYGLTPAEARLARALLAGGGLRRAAAGAGMTYETARWYLKVLFQKTGTRRQSELVARLLADLGGAPLG